MNAPSNLQVRPAEPADLPTLVELASAAIEAPRWSLPVYRSLLEVSPGPLSRTVLVGSVSGQVVAFGVLSLLLSVTPPEAELETLVVGQPWRRQGIGQALLLKMLEEAREKGAAFVRLEVRRSNAAALALYRSVGFHVAGERKRYYRNPVDDAVLLEAPFR